MKQLYTTAFGLLLAFLGNAQYAQNFDTLVNTGSGLYDLLPGGWAIYEVGTGAAADGKYTVGTGSNNTGNAYSFGSAAGATDRAFGTLASGSNFPTLGVIFFNETDLPITAVTIFYTGEQWRFGGRTTGTKDTLRFEYSTDARGIVENEGTWTRVNALDFLSPISSTSSNAATLLDGNAAANRQILTFTITGLMIEAGQRLVLRWSDLNIASNDDGLAIDDFSISAGFATGNMTSGGTTTGGGVGDGGVVVSDTTTSAPAFQNSVAIDSSFLYLFGNLHGHSTHSDGRASTLQPIDDYNFARQAQGMDFLGISEHNHSTAGLQKPDYKIGTTQADQVNGLLNVSSQPFIALHGMEWGTISGGGHVLVYGFGDSLINWEANNYDIFVQKSDYLALFDKVRNKPGAVALLAHPNSSDYTGLTGGYKGVADSAVTSVAIESGPAFSTSTTYNNFPASLAYINYYRSLLSRGYRLGAHMDQDNHEMTFGTANGNRMVVLAKTRTRDALLAAIKAMRTYASNDYNARVSFTINNYIIGSSIITNSEAIGVITHTDGNGEAISAVQVYGGRVGGSAATLVHSATANTSFTTAQGFGETWYYYAIVTQLDGDKIITSPIWVTKTNDILPIRLLEFSGALINGSVVLNWKTGSEINASHFIVERAENSSSFTAKGTVLARGQNSTYSFTDFNPANGVNYYRLSQVDKDGKVEYSKVIGVRLEQNQRIVTISPNPTRGVITIRTKSTSAERVLIQIVDAAGNMVYNKLNAAASAITIDASGLPSGVYVIRVNDYIDKLLIAK